jgi:hypothetical protein
MSCEDEGGYVSRGELSNEFWPYLVFRRSEELDVLRESIEEGSDVKWGVEGQSSYDVGGSEPAGVGMGKRGVS